MPTRTAQAVQGGGHHPPGAAVQPLLPSTEVQLN